MLEFVLIGRGGQGVVIAGEILAKALFHQGYYVKSFPAFGTERRGAPVKAFLRVSQQEIKESFQIYQPNYYLVFNQTQISGIPDNALGLANSCETLSHPTLTCFNANSTALEFGLGSQTNPIINTAMLGGITALMDDLEFKNLETAIMETLPKHLWQKNIASAKASFEAVFQQSSFKHWNLKCA